MEVLGYSLNKERMRKKSEPNWQPIPGLSIEEIKPDVTKMGTGSPDGLCCPPGSLVTSGPGLMPGSISGSMVLRQSGPISMSVDHVVTKGHLDAQVLGCNLWQP